MFPKKKPRGFSRDFKLKVVERMEAGENVAALARELDVQRPRLYRWRNAFRSGGKRALRNRRGRPVLPPAVEMANSRDPSQEARDLVEARRRIAELERKIGQQQVDLDFFKEALRHLEASRRHSSVPGETASSRASKR
ncbi:helix-turn-helix domain-containing protein [Hoeflea sp. CAU 1731]